MFCKFCWNFHRIDNVERNVTIDEKPTEDNAYDVEVIAQLKRDDVKDDSDVVCEVEIPNSDYKQSEKIVYDGKSSYVMKFN